MGPKEFILKKVLGRQFPQEYLCASSSSLQAALQLVFKHGAESINVTDKLLFAGYKPLLMAMPGAFFTMHNITQSGRLEISLSDSSGHNVGTLILDEVQDHSKSNNGFILYRGKSATLRLLPRFQRCMEHIYYRFTANKKDPLHFSPQLYRQVRLAYAVPRTISLITVMQDNLYNVFPTDLHGRIDENHYLISLRRGGKADAQVSASGSILLSDIRPDFFREAYVLGKNHMQPLRGREAFPFLSASDSGELKIPVPEPAIAYRELVEKEVIPMGVHNIHIFSVIQTKILDPEAPHLVHIHRDTAAWRMHHGVHDAFLLR